MPLAFGIASRAPSAEEERAFVEMVRHLSACAGLDVVPHVSRSYEELVARFADGTVTLAWLPPLPFIALEHAQLATPLVSHHRLGVAHFDSVLLARNDVAVSSPRDLAGKRIAWADPLSASGYVFPRIQLAALGIDPRKAFVERVYGSHEAAVAALFAGQADLAATWAHAEPTGRILDGSWWSVPGARDALRVVMSFGAVPADVTAVRKQMHPAMRRELARALLEVGASPDGAALVRAAFGVDELRPWDDASYTGLRQAISAANAQGLLDAIQTVDLGRL